MKIVIAACAALALCIGAAPAAANSPAYVPVPKSLDVALQQTTESSLARDYGMQLDDGEYQCDRFSFTRYECALTFSATMTEDLTFIDYYGDEVTAMIDDQVECDTTAQVRRRRLGSMPVKSSGTLGGTRTKVKYVIRLDEPECEIVDW